MERRDFLKIAFGFTAGAVAFVATAKAAPLAPHTLFPEQPHELDAETQPALATQDDLDRAKVEEVRWHRHWGWHRHRHWGWRRRHWRRRHYWHRRHYWRRRHYGWRRHYWRRHRYW